MVPHAAMLDVPHEVVEHVSWLIYARRRERHSRWRRLSCFRQALLVLVHLRRNATLAELGAAFGVSTATAGRYVTETVDLLAEHAPTLQEALREPPAEGFVILDGTLIATDRVKADEPYYSQKHKQHGMNVQVIAAPDGTPLWFSRALPGRTADITAARAHGIVQACLSRMLLVLADKGYQGAHGTVRTPYKGRDLPERYRQFNRDHARYRAPGERAFARLKQWQIFRKARCSTNRISRTVAAFTPSRSPGAQDEKGSVSSTSFWAKGHGRLKRFLTPIHVFLSGWIAWLGDIPSRRFSFEGASGLRRERRGSLVESACSLMIMPGVKSRDSCKGNAPLWMD
ncbi:hypothetical protein KNE206_63620 [Kitasatospora sp. NE20-6]